MSNAVIINMSSTLHLSGVDAVLKAHFFPPITLVGDYELALMGLESWNSIPNITVDNNIFHYDSDREIEIPVGSYEINDIGNFLEKELQKIHGIQSEHEHLDKKCIQITGNNHTFKSEILCRFKIDFMKSRNIGKLLGFENVLIAALEKTESNRLINILKVETLRVECNIIRGSFNNGKPTHTIYEFFPDVPPGYKVSEVPRNLIYLPVAVRVIDNLEIQICDQDGKRVDLRGEKTSIRLHLRPQNAHRI